MSKQEKSKRLRKPNVYMGASGPAATPEADAPTGTSQPANSPIVMRTSPSSAVRAEPSSVKVNFDYSHIKRDLMRIAILAGSFFAILIVLSFFIK